jgi:hypothetical protein
MVLGLHRSRKARHLFCGYPQIALLGVCCSRGAGGTGDSCEELALQPLPLYSVPADNVTMVTVAPSADGRIFLGGAGAWLFWWPAVILSRAKASCRLPQVALAGDICKIASHVRLFSICFWHCCRCQAKLAACPAAIALADGHLYELQYSSEDSWRKRRCQKASHCSCLWLYNRV